MKTFYSKHALTWKAEGTLHKQKYLQVTQQISHHSFQDLEHMHRTSQTALQKNKTNAFNAGNYQKTIKQLN